MQYSDFEHDHPLESAILKEIDSEGLVLSRVDRTAGSSPGETADRHLVAVVAGEEGPRLVMANAWCPHGSEVHVRIRLDVPVADACRRFLPSTGEVAAKAMHHAGDEAAVAAFLGGDVRCLASDGNQYSTHYVLRVDPRDGSGKSIVVAHADRTGSEYAVGTSVRTSFDELLAWADEQFGPSAPKGP